MSLINCPNCGQSISKKASLCPKCGYALNDKKIICRECKSEYSGTLSACPSCGCPTPQKKKHTGFKIAAIIFIAFVLFYGVIFSPLIFNKAKKEEYRNNLNTAVETMLNGASKAEEMGNLTLNVWNNAIYQREDSQTDKYVKPNGVFVYDFNTALNSLYSEQDYQKGISELQENRTEVISLMQKLKDPPSEYWEAYRLLETFYENYSKLIKSAISPSGSLNSFSEEFHKYDSDTLASYEKLIIKIN